MSGSENLVHKSYLFPVGVGLYKGCCLPQILFIISMVRISRRSQLVEGFHLSGLRISSLFADYMVLLAVGGGLQLALEWFTVKCEASGMKICISKSKVMVLSRKQCPLMVATHSSHTVEEFKYLEVSRGTGDGSGRLTDKLMQHLQ